MTEENFERQRVPARLVAAREIAATERDWSAARAKGSGDINRSRQERIARSAAHQAFYEFIEIQGTSPDIILEVYAENPDLVNATLRRIEMEGQWDAADPFERELLGLLFDTEYRGSIHRIARDTDDAKRSITIPAGFTKEHGFVALRRHRRLMVARHIDGDEARRPQIEVDKVSTFALDIEKLAQLSDQAVSEVRLIVASTMLKAVNWGTLRRGMAHRDFERTVRQLEHEVDDTMEATDIINFYQVPDQEPTEYDDEIFEAAIEDLYNLYGTMRKYHMTPEMVQHRAFNVEQPALLRDPQGHQFIERALYERSDLLTPAATTYYVHS